MPEVYKAIDAWLLPPGADGKAPAASPRSPTEQRMVFQTILESKKRGTKSEFFAAFIARVPAFASLAPTEKPERLTTPLWPLWVDADEAEGIVATENIVALLPSVAIDKRPLAVERFRNAWLSKQAAERARHRKAVAEQEEAVAANDRDLAERKEKDEVTRSQWINYGTGAFGLTALLALLLALYGIERNTRLLEAVLRKNAAPEGES